MACSAGAACSAASEVKTSGLELDTGGDRSRGDAVDPHALLTQFHGGASRQLQHRGLGHRVVDRRPPGDMSTRTGHVHNAAGALSAHRPGGVLDPCGHPEHVHSQGVGEGAQVELLDGTESAEVPALLISTSSRPNRSSACSINPRTCDSSATSARWNAAGEPSRAARRLTAICLTPADEDGRAVSREDLGRRGAYATGGAGDDRHLPGQRRIGLRVGQSVDVWCALRLGEHVVDYRAMTVSETITCRVTRLVSLRCRARHRSSSLPLLTTAPRPNVDACDSPGR